MVMCVCKEICIITFQYLILIKLYREPKIVIQIMLYKLSVSLHA